MLRASAFPLVLCALLARSVEAQPDDASRSKARELTERAIEKVRTNQYEAAIELYQRAYDLSGEAILLSNIGSAYQSMGREERALVYFCRYLDEEPRGKLAGFARSQAGELASSLGKRGVCEPEPPPRKAAAPKVEAPADVPAESMTLAKRTEPRAKESSLSAPLRYGGLLVIGGGVVALGVGGYYGYVGKQASDKITNNKETWTDEVLDQQRIGRRANRLMKASLIGGGVAVVTGTALYVVGRTLRTEERRVAVTPTWTPETSGLAVVGVFD